MTLDAFMQLVRGYAGTVLSGLCQDPDAVELAVFDSQGRVFLKAKVSDPDFESLKYGDVYPALRSVLARAGAIQRDEEGKPFEVSFQFYDRTFERLAFTRVSVPGGRRGGPAVAQIRSAHPAGRKKRARNRMMT